MPRTNHSRTSSGLCECLASVENVRSRSLFVSPKGPAVLNQAPRVDESREMPSKDVRCLLAKESDVSLALSPLQRLGTNSC